MTNWKRTMLHGVICVGLLCLIWGGYILLKTYHADRILDIKEDDFSWVYQVDSMEKKDGEILLKGFAFQLGTDAVGDNYEIVLQELRTGEKIFLKMSCFERKDVNDYFICKYDYVQSGFEARIKEKKLDLQEKDYEVLLKIEGERKAYRTGTYLADGQLVYANPQEFVPPEVEGTDLEVVVEQGILRVYRPDFDIYVYQYLDELYWIIGEKNKIINEDTCMEYQLTTTQVNKLPESRLQNNYDWDNRAFEFSLGKLTEGGYGKYRVTKNKLPDEYSITKIWVGNYDKEWLWVAFFRPHYIFINE